MVEFILGIDMWVRAIIIAATLIICAAHFFGEYMPATIVACITVVIMLIATDVAPDGSKWALCGDFFGLASLHKFLLPKWWLTYFIGLFLFIVLI